MAICRRPSRPPRQGRLPVRISERKEGAARGFPWLLRVIDHEAVVLLDPKVFASLIHRPVVLLKRRPGRQSRQCSDKQPVALFAKISLDSARNSAAAHVIKATPVLSTRKMVIQRHKLGYHHFSLRRTTASSKDRGEPTLHQV
jgi:hypothetical protein